MQVIPPPTCRRTGNKSSTLRPSPLLEGSQGTPYVRIPKDDLMRHYSQAIRIPELLDSEVSCIRCLLSAQDGQCLTHGLRLPDLKELRLGEVLQSSEPVSGNPNLRSPRRNPKTQKPSTLGRSEKPQAQPTGPNLPEPPNRPSWRCPAARASWPNSESLRAQMGLRSFAFTRLRAFLGLRILQALNPKP